MKIQFYIWKLHSTAIVLFLLLASTGYAQQKEVSGYGKASYSVTAPGQFMRDWMIVGPVLLKNEGEANPDLQKQEKFFNQDDVSLISVNPKSKLPSFNQGGKTYSWTAHSSKTDIIDLDQVYNKDFAAAYALAEIKSDANQKVFLGMGSDDGVKVWLNGKLIHNNWTPRGIVPDDDFIELNLTKGSNQILIKVQDMELGWGFTARIFDKSAISDRLIASAKKGNLEEIKMLIDAGADLQKKNTAGLTALNSAKLAGREEVIKYLKTKGSNETPVPSAELLVDNEYNFLKGKKAPGIAVLVARDGKIIYNKGFGYANIQKNELITPQTKFRIGSITKQFIGAAILRLQEDGKISVKDKLSKFIPDFPRGEEVTIHHLLTHTSGIHSYTNTDDFVTKVVSPISETDLVAFIKKSEYDFSPGERYLYNNSGYFLLGYIIGQVTGKSYGQYLQDQFFQPLGMTNTGVHTSSLKLTNEANGYGKENGEYQNSLNWDMSWAGGAGSLYSTVEDLYRWNEALFNGKVLKEQSLKAAFTSVVLNNGKVPVEGKYGYGWAIQNYRGEEAIGHGGGLHGFSTRIGRYPKENLTVVMLTNVTPTEVNLDPNSIAEFFVWDKLEPQASFIMDTSIADDVKQYEGRYDFTNGMVMVVTSENNNLFAQLTGQPKFPIFPSAKGEYFWRVVDAKVKFVKNEKGEVTHGDFSQNGNQLIVPKLKDEPIVTIDPAILDFYVGKYDFGNNIQVNVTKEGGKLFVQSTNQPRFEILPLSEREFTLREINARVTFVREGAAMANKVILDIAGQKRDLPRIQ
jgi:CubicO group peptidase (beta-lactamase class C family)